MTVAFAFLVCTVVGQLIGSTIADRYGAFGLTVREISGSRVLGVSLVLAGAVLVSRGQARTASLAPKELPAWHGIGRMDDHATGCVV